MGGLFSHSSPVLFLLFLIDRLASGALLSCLPQTLLVTTSVEPEQVLSAGEDKLRVSWGLNSSFPSCIDQAYTMVKVTLCYAPESQAGREWRKTEDDLTKDKKCQFVIAMQPYRKANATCFECTLGRDLPSATYFVRVYAFEDGGTAVAYGQTTDAGLFRVVGVSGLQPWMSAAAGCLSALSVMTAILAFALIPKRKSLFFSFNRNYLDSTC